MTQLSPGIAHGCFELLNIASRHTLELASVASSFPRMGSVASSLVLEAAQALNWIMSNDAGIAIHTPTGARLYAIQSYQGRLRQALLDYIETLRPSWSELATFGRRKVISFAPPAIQQMISEAGLEDGVNDDVVSFWDAMASRARGMGDDNLTAIGRDGERLTIAHEKKRTGREPKWVSLDSNEKGYDVLSVIDTNDNRPCSIEVKASTQGTWGRFHLTRNEWDRALEAENHLFHLWDIAPNKPRLLAVISPEKMGRHIPLNSGGGQWETVAVCFSAFKADFNEPL